MPICYVSECQFVMSLQGFMASFVKWHQRFFTQTWSEQCHCFRHGANGTLSTSLFRFRGKRALVFSSFVLVYCELYNWCVHLWGTTCVCVIPVRAFFARSFILLQCPHQKSGFLTKVVEFVLSLWCLLSF